MTTVQQPTDLTVEDDHRADEDRAAAQNLADGLRALADLIVANPTTMSYNSPFSGAATWAFETTNIPVRTRDHVAAWARAGLRAGAVVTKHVGDQYAGVDIAFGSRVSLHVYADRDQVCERIVVGTREVTEEVPDPEALAAVPTVTVTRTVEDVEWRCESLLRPGPVALVAAAVLTPDAVGLPA